MAEQALSRAAPAASGARAAPRLAILVLGLLVAAAAQAVLRQGVLSGPATAGVLAAALVVAWQLPVPARLTEASARDRPLARARVSLQAAGYAVGSVGFAVAAVGAVALAADWHGSFDFFAPLVLAGMGLWGAGLALADRGGAQYVPARRWTAAEAVGFAGVVALGVFFRFHRYSEFPPAGGFCSVEEAFTGRTAAYILQGGRRPWEFLGDVWLPVPFFHYLGLSTTALRLPFTVVSALTVPALYFLLRELVSTRAALAGTALFAAARWHVIYGRHAHNIFATTSILVLLLYLCVRVHRRGGLAPYPWIGFLGGYTLYTYAGFRSAPLYVALFLLSSLAVHLRADRGKGWWNTALRRRLAGLGLAGLAFGIAVAPLAGQLRENPTYLFEAAFRSTVVNPAFREGTFGEIAEKKLQQARMALELFNHTGDSSEVFNLPPTPMLDPVAGLLLVIGAGYCALRWRPRFQGCFLLITAAQFVLGAVAVGHLDVRRLASIIPLLFVLAAFAADGLLSFFERRGKTWKRLFILLLVAALGVAVYDNYRVYFAGMMRSERVRYAFQTPYSTASKYLHGLPDGAYVLLVGNTLNFFDDNDYAWFRGDRIPGKVTCDLEPVLAVRPGPWSGKDTHLLILDPYEHEEISELMMRSLPGTHCAPWADADTPPWQRYTSCRLPAVAAPIPVVPTLLARYYRGEAAAPFLERRDRALSYALFPDECRLPLALDQPPCRAEYEGKFQILEAGLYELAAEAQGGTISLAVGGKVIGADPIELQAGMHEVRGEARFNTLFEAGARLRLRQAGAEQWSLARFERAK